MDKDGPYKDSPFYIREKIEIGVIAGELCPFWIKAMILIIMVIYMYGAMCLKYVSGAESFVEAMSFSFYGNSS
jgi:hypothetical protein